MDLQGKKIFTLAPGEYFELLGKVYNFLHCEHSCELYFLTGTENYFSYPEISSDVEKYVVLPDLLIEQPWEKDHEEVVAFSKLVCEMEKQVGIPINRLIIANERSFGRNYSQAKYYWQNNKIAQTVLSDSDQAIRICLRGVRFAYDSVCKINPHIMLGGMVGPIFNVFYYWVAAYLKVPYISCIESTFIPDSFSWASNWGSCPELINQRFHSLLEEKLAPSEKAQKIYRSFMDKPKVLPVYDRLWQASQRKVTLRGVYKSILDRFLQRLKPFLKGQSLANAKPFWQCVVNSHRAYINSTMQKKYYVSYSDNQLQQIKYIYYPMHQEPEFALNTRATSWYDQLNTVRLLSTNLPFGYRLLVKEHRFNATRRSIRYLKTLGSYPGVDLLDPFDDQFKYIQNADMIVTVNGTTGYEALLLGKRVFTLIKTHYAELGLARALVDINNIGSEILTHLTSEVNLADRAFKIPLFIEADIQSSFYIDDDISKMVGLLQNYLSSKYVSYCKERI